MTEEEWLRGNDPEHLAEHLFYHLRRPRKFRLFACACCTRFLHEMADQDFHKLLEQIIQFADGEIDEATLTKAVATKRQEFGCVLAGQPAYFPANAVGEAILRAATIPFSTKWEYYDDNDDCPYPSWVVAYLGYAAEGEDGMGSTCERTQVESAAQLQLLRDIFGNPFRPVAFDPAWRNSTAVGVARKMYDAREFGAMPILADALQDAGCEDAAILDHCRDPLQAHVRGCWVVDLVLGKS